MSASWTVAAESATSRDPRRLGRRMGAVDLARSPRCPPLMLPRPALTPAAAGRPGDQRTRRRRAGDQVRSRRQPTEDPRFSTVLGSRDQRSCATSPSSRTSSCSSSAQRWPGDRNGGGLSPEYRGSSDWCASASPAPSTTRCWPAISTSLESPRSVTPWRTQSRRCSTSARG